MIAADRLHFGTAAVDHQIRGRAKQIAARGRYRAGRTGGNLQPEFLQAIFRPFARSVRAQIAKQLFALLFEDLL